MRDESLRAGYRAKSNVERNLGSDQPMPEAGGEVTVESPGTYLSGEIFSARTPKSAASVTSVGPAAEYGPRSVAAIATAKLAIDKGEPSRIVSH